MKEILHLNLCDKSNLIMNWYKDKTKNTSFPIYSSYDIRDSGFKISNVDANIYPAGFNNICPTDKESTPELFDSYFRIHYGSKVNKILLFTEEHTKNPYYWDNVYTIKNLIEQTGRKVMVGIPQQFDQPMQLTSASGKTVEVFSAFSSQSAMKEFAPDLIVSNNDFSIAQDEWKNGWSIPVNPPHDLGWFQRKKSRYFKFYNQLVEELSDLMKVDPFLMNVRTEIFENFDVGDENSRKLLAAKVDDFIVQLKKEYEKRGIAQDPFLFVKNNAGTYGLGVIKVTSGADVLGWTYNSRKKMKAAKGGREVDEVIIQEGIPSVVQSDGATAEPVIYMVGCELAGGFLRTHLEKDSTESLNSPGAVYKRLCVSDLNVSLKGSPMENMYGWSARLGLLAIAYEAEEMGVPFKEYIQKPCGS